MDSVLNVLVVEDHDDLREVTVAALCAMGHAARGVGCAEALDDELANFRANLLVLDLNLPGESGFSLSRRIRQAEPDIGIIMVSARNQVRDKLFGYESGADIYLTKPTAPEELGAAIQALARRLRSHPAAAGHLTLNPVTLQLHGPSAVVNISDHERLMLGAFAKAAEHRLEIWQLLKLSGHLEESSKGAIQVQIVRLRKKLEEAGASAPTIKSIRGVGYQLCVPLVIGSVLDEGVLM